MRPIITRSARGEYSTILLSDGTVETMWFGDDGDQRMVNRSMTLYAQHRKDIERDMARQK